MQLLLANPGPDEDQLTLAILDSSGRSVGEITKTVQATGVDRVLFLFPDGGVNVSPGQLYELRLTGGTTFGWKYVMDGYEHGSASFNGRPLVAGARSTFLFRTFGAS
ncbi:MAG TPA: hypothetical protein VJN93_15750 [Candidatus Acidoferrum sp.]|nr:hypothetical protein [Candidatus Acidoferrum sp.]